MYGTPSISDTTLDPFVFTDANGSEEGSSRGESPVFIVSSPGAASSGSGTRASSPAYRSIRRHKKSRNGCRNCKKRRIKVHPGSSVLDVKESQTNRLINSVMRTTLPVGNVGSMG